MVDNKVDKIFVFCDETGSALYGTVRGALYDAEIARKGKFYSAEITRKGKFYNAEIARKGKIYIQVLARKGKIYNLGRIFSFVWGVY